jgi:pyridoxine 5-phosphate synthase
LRAAEAAFAAGADGLTAHLREDRRHIADDDIAALSELCHRLKKPLNFEMAVTEEMLAIALKHAPHAVCLVPERREERTTEGGLDVARSHNLVAPVVRTLRDAGIRVSLFIEPDPVQIAVGEALGADIVELHAGAFCDAVKAHDAAGAAHRLKLLVAGAKDAARRGLEVHAGHGIDFDSVGDVAKIPDVVELNIGHFLIGEAIFSGIDAAIMRMRSLMDAARAE